MTVPDIRVASPADAAAMVAKHGFAAWRGLLDPDLVHSVMERVIANQNAIDAYASPKHGTMRPGVMASDLRQRLLTPNTASTFGLMLGGSEFTISDDESPIFVSYKGAKPTVWHQDKCVNVKPSALVWIALTSCGVTSPSMLLALRGMTEPHPMFLKDEVSRAAEKDHAMSLTGWTVVKLEFTPGDAVFFNSYSIHKTYVSREMTETRVSVKQTAVPNA